MSEGSERTNGHDERICESCGTTGETVWRVRRVYVTPPDPLFPDVTETRETTMPDVEEWCFACLASYPHEPVTDH